MTETSRQAWAELQDSLPERQLEVLDALTELERVRGPVTAGELGAASGIVGVWKRFSELERKGFIRRASIRPCRITGRMVTAWRTT